MHRWDRHDRQLNWSLYTPGMLHSCLYFLIRQGWIRCWIRINLSKIQILLIIVGKLERRSWIMQNISFRSIFNSEVMSWKPGWLHSLKNHSQRPVFLTCLKRNQLILSPPIPEKLINAYEATSGWMFFCQAQNILIDFYSLWKTYSNIQCCSAHRCFYRLALMIYLATTIGLFWGDGVNCSLHIN